MISFGWWSVVGSSRLHACNQVERSCFQSSVRGTVCGRFAGSFINGSRDSKYNLHRHDLLLLQLDDGNDRDLNQLCIFILIFGVRRHDFFCFHLHVPTLFPTPSPCREHVTSQIFKFRIWIIEHMHIMVSLHIGYFINPKIQIWVHSVAIWITFA
jgi:hypothetical protein